MVPKNQRGYTLYSKKLKEYICLLRGAVSTTKAKKAKFSLKQGGCSKGGGGCSGWFYCIVPKGKNSTRTFAVKEQTRCSLPPPPHTFRKLTVLTSGFHGLFNVKDTDKVLQDRQQLRSLFFVKKNQRASWKLSLPPPALLGNLCRNSGFVVKVIGFANEKKNENFK